MTPATNRAVVTIAGDDIYEDLFGVGAAMQSLLSGLGLATSLRMGMGWIEASPRPDLMVMYTAMGALSDSRMSQLSAHVAAGCGLLVLHSSTVFPSEDDRPVAPFDRAFALYGSRYVSHGPVPHSSLFTVEFDQEHELTAGLEAWAIEHEHYSIELAPDAQVVAWRDTVDGREPIAHVRTEGAGRVCYLQLGHSASALAEPGVRQFIARAVDWLAPTAAGIPKGNI